MRHFPEKARIAMSITTTSIILTMNIIIFQIKLTTDIALAYITTLAGHCSFKYEILNINFQICGDLYTTVQTLAGITILD